MHWLFLGIAILFETLGTTLLKASDGMSRAAPGIGAFAAYAVSFWLLSLALRVIPVGVAYAIWAGLGICLIAAIGWVLFGQKLDWAALLGIALILSGILVINLFSAKV